MRPVAGKIWHPRHSKGPTCSKLSQSLSLGSCPWRPAFRQNPKPASATTVAAIVAGPLRSEASRRQTNPGAKAPRRHAQIKGWTCLCLRRPFDFDLNFFELFNPKKVKRELFIKRL